MNTVIAAAPKAESVSPCDPINAARADAVRDALTRAEQRINDESHKRHFHPLEAIPFFRRWPRSFVRNVVYTLIFNLIFAIIFTFMGYFGILTSGKLVRIESVIQGFGSNLIIANVIGFMFWGILELLGPVTRWISKQHFLVVAFSYTVLGTGIVTLSFVLISQVPGFTQMSRWILTPSQLLSSFIISFVISLVLASVWRRRVAELAGEIALAEERERSEAASRAASEANLRALQAQIEPHFLFNTLANVTSLIHAKPDDAKRMLEEFIMYLRATLAQSREATTTLEGEFALMEKFLNILKVRMGSRLSVHTDLPRELNDFVLPPMLLQPMVENAIKHGLEPKIEGGSLTLSAAREAEHVAITIADTGLGFQDSTSNGIGLKNVRERLEKLYGERAMLSIEENQPSGTRIVIRIPTLAN